MWFVMFKEVLDMLFSPTLIQQDDTEGEVLQNEERGRLQLGGLGSSANMNGKYEGFGSSPLNREGNVLHVCGLFGHQTAVKSWIKMLHVSSRHYTSPSSVRLCIFLL
jgi:hypothetical protein